MTGGSRSNHHPGWRKPGFETVTTQQGRRTRAPRSPRRPVGARCGAGRQHAPRQRVTGSCAASGEPSRQPGRHTGVLIEDVGALLDVASIAASLASITSEELRRVSTDRLRLLGHFSVGSSLPDPPRAPRSARSLLVEALASEPAGSGWDHRGFVVFTGERSDRVQRVEPHDRDELHFLAEGRVGAPGFPGTR